MTSFSRFNLLARRTPVYAVTLCLAISIVNTVALDGFDRRNGEKSHCAGGGHGQIRQEQTELPSRDAPEWPILVFRQAEEIRERGNRSDAISHYRDLVDYSMQFPKRRSSIAGIAFWRILLNAESTEIPLEWVFKIADGLLGDSSNIRRFLNADPQYSGTSLSEFAVQIWHALASIAWQAPRQDRPRAIVYLFGSGAYISPRSYELQDKIRSSLDRRGLTRSEQEKMERLSKLYGFDDMKFNGAQLGNIGLLTGIYLTKLREFSAAASFLRGALDSEDSRTRTLAGMHLAKIGPRVSIGKDEIIHLLTSAIENAKLANDSIAVQKALIQRALVFDKEPNPDFSRSVTDLQEVIKAFSTSSFASRSLFLMARWHEWKNEYKTARRYYEKTIAHRDVQGAYHWRESAHFRASMMRYSNGDLRGAISDLEELGAWFDERRVRSTRSPYYAGWLYWLGRMYAEVGRKEESEKLFGSLIDKTPFDFYAIRARMYLKHGPKSSTLEWLGGTVEESLRNAYHRSSDVSLEIGDQDHSFRRLLWALKTGLYRDAFRASQCLIANGTVQFNGRDPYFLSESRLLVPLVVWHSLREDAIVSCELRNSVRSRVHVANKLAGAGDFETAQKLLSYHGTDLKHAGYLSALHPRAFRAEILAATSENRAVPPELLYGIMHQESRFSLGATSETGARGLFQFQPESFFKLDERWGLLKAVPNQDVEGYLADQKLSVRLGTRWFEHILEKRKNDIVVAIMEHHAGPDRVNKWFSVVNEGGGGRFLNDLELKIEMARQPTTRIFTRRVLTSMWISKASGMFEKSSHN